MATTRLIVVRHGETLWNVEGKHQGHLDSPLTETGLAQGRALAARLVKQGFSALYSSDLGRAHQTARMIAAQSGHAILVDARLRERNLGIFQGLTKEEIQQKFPDEFRLYRTSGPDYAVPQGESARERFDLIVECIEQLAAKHVGQQIVVVTHGGVLNTLFRHVTKLPLEAPRRFSLLNGSLNTFCQKNGKWVLETWGDVSHLESTRNLDEP